MILCYLFFLQLKLFGGEKVTERRGLVTVKGDAVTLVGDEVKIGQKAPDCTVIDSDLKPVSLSTFFTKHLLLLSVPSLDTPVCSIEAKRFNDEISQLKDVKVVLVSMDLPFAQKRWCGFEKATHISVFSDYRLQEFGERYGTYIRELGLLARTLFIIDPSGIVRYIDFVSEVSQEPDYTAVLDYLKGTLSS